MQSRPNHNNSRMLSRLLARWRRADAAPAGAPAAAPLASAPAPAIEQAIEPVAAADVPAMPAVSAWHVLARRPLIDARGAIAGWDLRLSNWASQRLARSSAQRVLQETYGYALVQAARAAQVEGRKSLVTMLGLSEPAPLLDSLPQGTIVVVGDGSGNPHERVLPLLDRLKLAGVQLAAPPELADALPVDYALLDAARLGSAEALRRCRQPAPTRAGWVATNLSSFDDIAEAVRLKARFACGRIADGRPRAGRAAAPPAAVHIATILTRIVNDGSTREIAALFKADVNLSYRLLRYLSMAGVAAGRAPDSLQDAVMLLGTRELHRWLCVLLADAGASPVGRALHETALTRGRMLELLATLKREPHPESLFVLGAFSLLDLLLDVPLDVALALTPLPEPAVEALISESGPWRPYLDVALAMEAGDAPRLDAACAALQLPRDEVIVLGEKAAAWSAQAAATMEKV